MAADVRMEWNEPAFNHVFRSWEGPVGKDIKRRCRTLEVRAMAHVGFDTGQLLSVIDSDFGHLGGELLATVGANPKGGVEGYALYHHEGTRPHPIHARNVEFLRFPDRRNGTGFVYRRSVFHPGTKANPYLTRFLREVIA